jgi:hypothetical protein
VLDVISRVAKLLTAIALAGSIGLHLAFLQSAAWIGMMITYSQEAPLTEALSKTFDGKHPCSLCKRIEKERKTQHKSDRQFECKKLDLVNVGGVIVLTPPSRFQKLGFGNDWAPQSSQTPPVPPPRVA